MMNFINWLKRIMMFPLHALLAKLKKNAEIFTFGLLSELGLLDPYCIDLPSLFETLPYFETRS